MIIGGARSAAGSSLNAQNLERRDAKMPVESIVETKFEETHENHTAQEDLWDKLKIAVALIGLVSAIYTAELTNHYQKGN
jgi:hypothetical protein